MENGTLVGTFPCYDVFIITMWYLGAYTEPHFQLIEAIPWQASRLLQEEQSSIILATADIALES